MVLKKCCNTTGKSLFRQQRVVSIALLLPTPAAAFPEEKGKGTTISE
ncbi:hypothetical protein [Porphyromonas canoris]|nr:hypothetical protein [Porphyromonas canoris]